MNLQTVTDLVNCLFSTYEHTIRGLDWDSKIDEYVNVINDLITYDTDLNDLYKKIRQNYQYRKLPTPYDVKRIISDKCIKEQNQEYVSHPDNDKLVVILCYKNGEVKETRQYILRASGNCKSIREIAPALRERFDDIKVLEFPKGTTIQGNEAGIPRYENGEETTEWQRIA